MRGFLLRSVSLAVVLPAWAFQPESATLSHKSVLERRGLYHANISGQFQKPDGQPLSGVHVQLNAGRIRSLPLADAVTGADGRFSFRDINSTYMPDLRWYPPEEWLQGAAPITGESGENIDAGIFRLQPDTLLRVATEIIGGPPLGPKDREATIVLQGSGPIGRRIVAEQVGGYRLLRQIPFDEGTWDITLYTNGRSEHFGAPFHVQRGRRDQMLLLRLHREKLRRGQYVSEGDLEIQETRVAPTAVEREFQASGRLVAPDGSAIEGAIVGINDFFLRRTRPQWTSSDSQGRFHLAYSSTACNDPAISYGHGDYWVFPFKRPEENETCDSRWKESRELTMPVASRLSLKVTGATSSALHAYWWHDAYGCQGFSSLSPWIWLSGFQPILLKVEADGFVPQIHGLRPLRKPRIRRSENDARACDHESNSAERRSDFELVPNHPPQSLLNQSQGRCRQDCPFASG